MNYKLTIQLLDKQLKPIQDYIREQESESFSKAFSSALVKLRQTEELPDHYYSKLLLAEAFVDNKWIQVEPSPEVKKKSKKDT